MMTGTPAVRLAGVPGAETMGSAVPPSTASVGLPALLTLKVTPSTCPSLGVGVLRPCFVVTANAVGPPVVTRAPDVSAACSASRAIIARALSFTTDGGMPSVQLIDGSLLPLAEGVIDHCQKLAVAGPAPIATTKSTKNFKNSLFMLTSQSHQTTFSLQPYRRRELPLLSGNDQDRATCHQFECWPAMGSQTPHLGCI